jgi:hypothetical protein
MPCRQLDCRAASQLDGFRLTQRQPDCFCVNLTHVCVHLTSIAFCGLRTRRQPMAWNRRAHQSCSPVVTSLWRVHAAEVGVRFSPCTTDRCPTPAGSRLRAHDTHLAMPEVSSSYRIRHGSVRFRVPKSSVLGCSTKAAVSIGIERGPASYEDHTQHSTAVFGLRVGLTLRLGEIRGCKLKTEELPPRTAAASPRLARRWLRARRRAVIAAMGARPPARVSKRARSDAGHQR